MALNCPTCETALARRSIGGETVDYCDSCKGAWYESSELASILRGMDGRIPSTPPLAPPKRIACPRCCIEVNTTIYAYDSGIPILKCSRCKGVWLVDGQLERLALYNKTPGKTDGLENKILSSAQTPPQEQMIPEWELTVKPIGSRIPRILSAVFALTILAIAALTGKDAIGLVVLLTIPLSCIWFPDELGKLTGTSLGLVGPTITEPTPAIAVAIAGWILMFVVACLIISGYKTIHW